ncbi:pitrilysin family protein [Gaiella sp.]|uniref:M16 family metallopeptidase n=1 Tax=Gaiella sp. TaxID=2663207 RepID=UPI00326358CF
MKPHRLTILPGGERVITERIEGVRSAAIGLWIGAGSRDEPVTKAGVSHFIEHLLFKGTERYDAVEIAELFDTMGGELNAATSRETTVVYTRVPDDHLDVALEVMTDMVFAPSLNDIDSEREVVLEEIAMVDDNPQDLVHDLAAESVFGDHPLGRPVIGRAEVIASISRRSLLGYHRSAYAGPNVVLAAAGNVDHKRIVAALRKSRKGVESKAAALPRKPAGRVAAPGIRFLKKNTEQYHVCLAGPGIRRDDPRRYASALLDAILGGSASSRLFQEIREKRGMAYSVYSYGSQYLDAGQIGIYVGTREENLRECLEVIGAELRDVGAGNLRNGELERAKENMKGRLLLSLESTSARMSRLGKAVVLGMEILPIEEIERRIVAVTEDDVAALARDLYTPELLSAAGIGPSEKLFRTAVQRLNPSAVERAA